MKVLFMGTPDFAVPCLKALCKDHEVVAVVTQPDKSRGRGKKVQFPPVKEVAIEQNIPVFQFENIKSDEAVAQLEKFGADLFVVVAYGQILTEKVLSLPKIACINVHGSLLPKYRGAAPIEWAIINGETKTGVTIMHMVKGIDKGNMIMKREVDITPEDDGETIYEKLSNVGAIALLDAIDRLEAGFVEGEKQDNALSSYAPMLTNETGKIDWNKDAKQIVNLVRGLVKVRLAYTTYDNTVFKIIKAEVFDSYEFDNSENKFENGQIIDIINKKGIVVKCRGGAVVLTKIQPPGKNVMHVPDYLRGNKMEINAILGE